MSGGAVSHRKASATQSWGAIRSPVYWALLGLVIERAGYGYELLKRFERDFGDILPISSESHIYRALSVLESRGLIEEVPGTETSQQASSLRQPKPHYRATLAGMHGYRDWLLAQVRSDRRQSQLFMRQLAVFAREPEVGLEILERYSRACLEEAQSEPIASGDHSPDTPSGLAARLISEESRLVMEARLPWIAYARRQFEALSEVRRSSDEPA
jgi:DNA-binding PadR family transcriptional regulator